MTLVKGSERMVTAADTSPSAGVVRWSPVISIWMTAMTLLAVVAGPLTFTWDALAVFLILSAITLCAGHSVGMHRRLIHNSFECPLWLEYAMVYLGVLVGMTGPIGMIRVHEIRDWAQRQAHCHDYLCHRRNFWQDGFWQLHCELELARPPKIEIEPRVANDRVYQWMERTWMWQQVPLAIILFALGGWSWVVWGVPVRVAACVTGHWLVGHYAHRQGPQSWHVLGAGVQGFDVPIAALLSMGESWHNNHHAYPGSARMGILPNQPDPGWWLIRTLEWLGLAWNIRTPDKMPYRPELVRLQNDGSFCPALKRMRRLLGHASSA
jgi:stearoyl-CoA desaturase (delta-9 desaturase)